MAPPFTLRAAVPADAEFCLLVELASMRDYLQRADDDWDADRHSENFLRYGFDEGFQVIVAEDHDVGVLQVTERDGLVWDLERLLLLPGWQARGLGSAVLEEVLADADAQGAEVHLTVFSFNPARRLYERFGFEATGGGDTRVLMRRASRADRPTSG